MNEQGLNYVKQQLTAGINPQALKQAMIAGGWQSADVDTLISAATGTNLTIPETPQSASVINPTLASVINPTLLAENPRSASVINPTLVAENPRSKPKLGLVFLAIVILVIILGLIGIYFFYSPQRVFAQIVAKSSSIKSYSYNYNVTADISASSGSNTFSEVGAFFTKPSKFSMNLSGATDITDALKPQSNIVLDGNWAMGATVQKVAGEIRYIDNNLYVKASTLPQFGFDLTSILDMWVKIDSTQLNQSVGSDVQTQLSADEIAKIQKVYSRNSFIKFSSLPKIEKINNDTTLHYIYTVDNEKLLAFVNDYSTTILGLPSDSLDQNSLKSSLPTISGNIWVGILDFLPRKFDLNLGVKADSMIPVDAKVVIGGTMTNFNKPVSIETPLDTVGLDEVEKAITPPAPVVKVDTDKDGLNNDMEKIWGTDQTKADTDGDGHNDFAEICGGYNPTGPGNFTDTQLKLSPPGTCPSVLQ